MGTILHLPTHRKKVDGTATLAISFRDSRTLDKVMPFIGEDKKYKNLYEFAKKAFMTFLFLHMKEAEGYSIKLVDKDGTVRGLNL